MVDVESQQEFKVGAMVKLSDSDGRLITKVHTAPAPHTHTAPAASRVTTQLAVLLKPKLSDWQNHTGVLLLPSSTLLHYSNRDTECWFRRHRQMTRTRWP